MNKAGAQVLLLAAQRPSALLKPIEDSLVRHPQSDALDMQGERLLRERVEGNQEAYQNVLQALAIQGELEQVSDLRWELFEIVHNPIQDLNNLDLVLVIVSRGLERDREDGASLSLQITFRKQAACKALGDILVEPPPIDLLDA
ncbi:hypothetical protein AB4Z10_13175 [Bosea sp. RAF48]|uniref:hypothetical protein n=1 Tax=Bosea sp. RAF48 TaxID=3237480 RepID=UPI003F916052